MAKKRMTTTQITDSDDFIALGSPAQALYLHLNNGADDDGFNNQVQMAMFKAHASVDDLKLLLAKRFILQFESGVIVIKHWRMANAIRKDRYTPTVFQEELKQLGIKDNGSYTWLTDGCQAVATEEDSKGKKSIEHKKFVPPTLEEVKAFCEERGNNVDYKKFYESYSVAGWKDSKGQPVKNWKQKMIAVWENNATTRTSKREDIIPTYDTSTNPELDEDRYNEIMRLRNVSKEK